ncbi:MAG TPA: hypothetical protein VFP56_09265 [Candidatus Limnocylindrales bacterium]|nr:hypothetical protein [Candidatus Limnocylindrales bacterium]
MSLANNPWEEPGATRPVSGLFGSVDAEHLSLGTAIEAAFKSLAKPAFILPIVVIAVVINAVLELTLLPVISRSVRVSPGGQPTIEDMGALMGAAGVTFIVSLIGSILAAVYGQVWAVAASVGPFPTVGETLALVRRRWLGVLGAGLLVGLLTIGVLAGGVVVLAVLGSINRAIAFGVAVGLAIVFIWFVARLYMAPWLAADGAPVVESVQRSWLITRGSVLRIIGWTIAYGLLFALLAGALGVVLGRVPLIGQGIGQGISLALGYAAGVTLYRRTQAAAMPPGAASGVPPVTGTPIG